MTTDTYPETISIKPHGLAKVIQPIHSLQKYIGQGYGFKENEQYSKEDYIKLLENVRQLALKESHQQKEIPTAPIQEAIKALQLMIADNSEVFEMRLKEMKEVADILQEKLDQSLNSSLAEAPALQDIGDAKPLEAHLKWVDKAIGALGENPENQEIVEGLRTSREGVLEQLLASQQVTQKVH